MTDLVARMARQLPSGALFTPQPWTEQAACASAPDPEEYHADVRDVRYPGEHRAFGPFAEHRSHLFPLGAAHRITHVEPGTTTLVIVGRKLRTWGFYDSGRFVDWRDALGIRPTEGSRSTGKYPKGEVA